MAGVLASSCCVCRCQLNEAIGKGRHKKLRSCSKERPVWEQFAKECGCFGTIGLAFQRDTNSVLCYSCIERAKKLLKFQQQLTGLQKEMAGILRCSTDDTREMDCSNTSTTLCTTSQQSQTPHRANQRVKRPKTATEPAKRPRASIIVRNDSGDKLYNMTPSRDETAVKLARRSYPSFTKTVVENHSDGSITAFGNVIKGEITKICSDSPKSLLQSDEVTDFTWDTIWSELQKYMPRLVSFLQEIIPEAFDGSHRRIIAMIISIILKYRNPKMCLIQKVVSVFLFGNSVHKKVYNCLQPLMVSLSYSATIQVIDRLTTNHDSSVLDWRNSLLHYLPEPQDGDCDDFGNESGSAMINRLGWKADQDDASDSDSSEGSLCGTDQAELDDFLSFLSIDDHRSSDPDSRSSDTDSGSSDSCSSDSDSDSDTCSIAAPPFSPVMATQDFHSEQLSSEALTSQDSRSTMPPSSLIDISETVIGHDHETVRPTLSGGEPVQCVISNAPEIPVEASRREDTFVGSSRVWNGFKLVGDNIDKNYRQSFHRVDKKTTSIHYFHHYALLDRIDLSGCSEALPTKPLDVEKFMINLDDLAMLNDDVIVLISRILVQNVDSLKDQAKDVTFHIKSDYASEMSKHSTVVPLGVIKKCENKVDEMCLILKELHKYVPTEQVTLKLALPTGDFKLLNSEVFHRTLLGGDQLTAARTRSSCLARVDHGSSGKRLSGVLPVIEDWHAKMCYLKAFWNMLCKKGVAIQKGSLPQLKHLIHCTANLDPTKNMKGCEDFLTTVLYAHVISAANEILSGNGDGYTDVTVLSREIVTRFLSFDPDIKDNGQDKVRRYALQVLNLGLLWHGFNDAIKEGDGNRIFNYYKFFLLVYKAGKCHNYCKEIINLFLQYHFLFTERQAQQLKWCRVVNTQGKPGKNVSCDLHIEHLNNRLKGMINNIHAKNPDNAIDRVAKSIGTVHQVCEIFERENHAVHVLAKHNKPSFAKELDLMVKELDEQQVFKEQDRNPRCYRRIKNVLQLSTKEQLRAWIPKKVKNYQL